MMRSNRAHKLAFLHRKCEMTTSVPGSARCRASSKYGRSSGNIGLNGIPWPLIRSVFGLFTRMVPFSQSISLHFNSESSVLMRRPPWEARATNNRDFALRQASNRGQMKFAGCGHTRCFRCRTISKDSPPSVNRASVAGSGAGVPLLVPVSS